MDCCETSGGARSPMMGMHGVPFVPLPAVIIAFVFGIMFGVMMGRRREMMMQGGWQGGMHRGMHGSKPWMAHGMKPHHHHGEGMPACREEHGKWPEPAAGADDAAQS